MPRESATPNVVADRSSVLSFYGFDPTRPHSHPWEFQQVRWNRGQIPSIVDVLAGRNEFVHIVPQLIDRSFFNLDDRPRRLPRERRYYYFIMLQITGNSWTIGQALKELRERPPVPARPGDVQAVTPNELVDLCGDCCPEPGTVYQHFYPIVALGGRQHHVRQKRQHLYTMLERWEIDDAERTVLRIHGNSFLPARCGILVRSRRRL